METPLYSALAAAHLLQLAPDPALLLLTAGIFLLYVEFNRPGSILPGAAGLLATLFAIASLAPLHPQPTAIFFLCLAVGLLLLDLRRPTHILLALGATLALIFGFLNLVTYPRPHTATAIACGLLLGAGTSLLTRIARRARTNKGLDLQRARTSRPGASKS